MPPVRESQRADMAAPSGDDYRGEDEMTKGRFELRLLRWLVYLASRYY